MRNVRQGGSAAGTITNGGFEAKLWQTADALRNNMDAAEYKHVGLAKDHSAAYRQFASGVGVTPYMRARSASASQAQSLVLAPHVKSTVGLGGQRSR